MKKILVGGSVTFNNVATPYDLADGGLGIYAIDPDTHLLEKYASSDNYAKFMIGQGTSYGYSRLSEQIDVAGIKRMTKMLYKAPVKPIIRLSASYDNGVDSAFGLYQYDEWQVRYDVRFGAGFSGQEVQSKTYSVVGVQASASALYTALAAEVNNDPDSDVVATAASTYVQLTPKVYGQYIDGAIEYFPELYNNAIVMSGTKAYVGEMDFGSGSYAQVLAMEEEFRVWEGSNEVTDRFTPLPPTYAVSSTTYDLLLIEYNNLGRPNHESLGKPFDTTNIIVVAAPASHASFAALVTAVENITGKTVFITPNTTTTTTAGA